MFSAWKHLDISFWFYEVTLNFHKMQSKFLSEIKINIK